MKSEKIINKTVVKRNGEAVAFDPSKIRAAILLNALDVRGVKEKGEGELSQADRDLVDSVADAVVERIARKLEASIPIEDIQDLVELSLMRVDHALARAYVLYREKRTGLRNLNAVPIEEEPLGLVCTRRPGDEGDQPCDACQ
ncbi:MULTISPECIES: ATP cone domain-containing protein [Pandoraea]|uniref:Ribonucleoside-diphosphate reductase subunit alpha n=2 Tax=Pandoraea TaxID=93217 RepID=A0A5E4XCH8_9BURK|nr:MULTISPECIES: ATP cone domain-containing protein [Pandoraea]VVE16189.1 ribonucleoside-diphosphate reductase subunit alpha [Pandoraea cepalis]VVE33915.1 ribonucleoside-diphosphate reductase subunit alpha [Pandoraea terrigena]